MRIFFVAKLLSLNEIATVYKLYSTKFIFVNDIRNVPPQEKSAGLKSGEWAGDANGCSWMLMTCPGNESQRKSVAGPKWCAGHPSYM